MAGAVSMDVPDESKVLYLAPFATPCSSKYRGLRDQDRRSNEINEVSVLGFDRLHRFLLACFIRNPSVHPRDCPDRRLRIYCMLYFLLDVRMLARDVPRRRNRLEKVHGSPELDRFCRNLVLRIPQAAPSGP